MSSKITVARSGGISLFGLLGILFIVLKLIGVTEVATWSWFWVLSPLWIGLAVSLTVLVGMLLFVLLVALFAAIFG
jgi:hypothetical protein